MGESTVTEGLPRQEQVQHGTGLTPSKTHSRHKSGPWSWSYLLNFAFVSTAWAVSRQLKAIEASGPDVNAMVATARDTAQAIADDDAEWCRQIGQHGLQVIRDLAAKKPPGEPVNILTHCNAGWLAFVDYGTATSPIYAAHDSGIKVHVWVDETRPRNQGAKLTAWELGQHGVPHTIIADNVGGHLMQHGYVCGSCQGDLQQAIQAFGCSDRRIKHLVG